METKEKIIAGSAAAIIGVVMLKGCSDEQRHSRVHTAAVPSRKLMPQTAPKPTKQPDQTNTGFVNLNAVRDAFKSNQSMPDFEKRTNEIFEGDHMVVFEAKEISNGFVLKAREDLDDSKSTTDADDLIFTLTVQGRTATLQGAGVNEYYKESWLFELPTEEQQKSVVHHHRSSMSSSPFFWWWVMSPGWHGYHTPMYRYDSMYSSRNIYRRSSAYNSQRSNNRAFGTQMGQKYGNSYHSAASAVSPQRKSYVRKSSSSSGSKDRVKASTKHSGSSSKSQVRSKPKSTSSKSYSKSSRRSSSSRSSSSSSRSYGGFRGSSGFGI